MFILVFFATFLDNLDIITAADCHKVGISDGGVAEVKGCRAQIPFWEKNADDVGTMVAGRFYEQRGNFYNIEELSCNGKCNTVFAGTKMSHPQTPGEDSKYLTGSIIINPGCTLFIFSDYNFKGDPRKISGPKIIPNLKIDNFFGPIDTCSGASMIPCIKSMIWSCEPIFPSGEASDGERIVAVLDNRASTVDTVFTYENTVGTVYSEEIKKHWSVQVDIQFWGIMKLLGVKGNFDWTKVNTETMSESKTYRVQVTIPKNTHIKILGYVGFYGKNIVHTQRFSVEDVTTGKRIQSYTGKLEKYDIRGAYNEAFALEKEVCSADPPSAPEGATSNWENALNSTKIVGTVVTYRCPYGDEMTVTCDEATQSWIPAIGSCRPRPVKPKKPSKGKKPKKG